MGQYNSSTAAVHANLMAAVQIDGSTTAMLRAVQVGTGLKREQVSDGPSHTATHDQDLQGAKSLIVPAFPTHSRQTSHNSKKRSKSTPPHPHLHHVAAHPQHLLATYQHTVDPHLHCAHTRQKRGSREGRFSGLAASAGGCVPVGYADVCRCNAFRLQQVTVSARATTEGTPNMFIPIQDNQSWH